MAFVNRSTKVLFGKKFDLFSIVGFRVSLDLTWFILAVLVVWSLAEGYFPEKIEGLNRSTALWLAIGGALGLFVSIILHEFSHAIVARRFNIPIAGITLFIFGGVAEMEKEPPSARSEFFMAIAGPIASYVLAYIFYLVTLALPEATASSPLAALFSYLAFINTLLATFNLIPAFPLDGGRVFRAVVWGISGDLAKATRQSAATGRFLGTALIIFGLFSIVTGNFVAGLWQGLIGLFITGAASSSEMQMTLKSALHGVNVAQIMSRNPVTVRADMPVGDLIESFFYRYTHKAFPVEKNGVLIGWIRLEDVSKMPTDERMHWTAAEVISRDSADKTIDPETSALDALSLMTKNQCSRLMVARDGKLMGMITMRDIMGYITIHRELDAGPVENGPPDESNATVDRS